MGGTATLSAAPFTDLPSEPTAPAADPNRQGIAALAWGDLSAPKPPKPPPKPAAAGEEEEPDWLHEASVKLEETSPEPDWLQDAGAQLRDTSPPGATRIGDITRV